MPRLPLRRSRLDSDDENEVDPPEWKEGRSRKFEVVNTATLIRQANVEDKHGAELCVRLRKPFRTTTRMLALLHHLPA
ncbi:hypothetical protein FBZ93_109363 [Bradyrhizobium macuxiense]|uniref:Uncharacterized protein n=1 Tax=Bradyrhizobium macuxiense TaxID=1755647 RepID=A0A560LHC4_9BRAD|nr:hypothetical protein FBZ93_109363 [Bradyrhizobium macuxiense]